MDGLIVSPGNADSRMLTSPSCSSIWKGKLWIWPKDDVISIELNMSFGHEWTAAGLQGLSQLFDGFYYLDKSNVL